MGGVPGAGGGAGHEGREGDRGGQLRPRRQRVRPVQGQCAPASLAVPEGKTTSTFLHLSFCIDSTAFVNKDIFSILYIRLCQAPQKLLGTHGNQLPSLSGVYGFKDFLCSAHLVGTKKNFRASSHSTK